VGSEYLEKALAEDTNRSEEYARILTDLARILWYCTGDQTRALDLMNESLGIWRTKKNLREQAIVLSQLGKHVTAFSKDYLAGAGYCEESLEIARKVGDEWLVNDSLAHLCQSYMCLEKFEQGKPFVEELVTSSEKLEQPWEMVLSHHFSGDCALGLKDFQIAERKYGVAVSTALKYEVIAYVAFDLQGVAFSVSGQSRWAKAIRLDAAARRVFDRIGFKIDGAAEFWDNFIDTYIEFAKKQLSEKLTQQYMEEGRAMEIEQAVEYALDIERD
jgi:tetratricopeptide (TPR) repeat protein